MISICACCSFRRNVDVSDFQQHGQKIQDKSEQQFLIDISTEFNLTQIHDKPTREDNILDLVFTTDSLGGNVHRILLQNEPIFTKFQENTHSEGKQIWNFSYLIIFLVLGRWHFRALIPILSTFNTRHGFKHCH